MVKLHREGSAPAACTAVLFSEINRDSTEEVGNEEGVVDKGNGVGEPGVTDSVARGSEGEGNVPEGLND